MRGLAGFTVSRLAHMRGANGWAWRRSPTGNAHNKNHHQTGLCGKCELERAPARLDLPVFHSYLVDVTDRSYSAIVIRVGLHWYFGVW